MRIHSLLAFLLAVPAFAQFPDGYVDEEVVSLFHPVATAHDANGQLYVALRDGRVFVVQDGKAYLHPVTTGLENETEVEILDNLEAGMAVVLAGQHRLKDQAPVTVIPAKEGS